MVAAFDFCLHGRGGAAPSIDTAMHGLVDRRPRRPPPPRQRHRHRHRGRRRAAHQGHLRRPGRVGARGAGPGFQLGLDIAAVHARQPAGRRRDPRRPRHHRVGRDQRRGRGATAAGSSTTAQAYIDAHGDPEPFGAVVDDAPAAARRRAPGQGRRARAAPPGRRLARPPHGRPLHRQRRRPRLPRRREAARRSPSWARRAPTTSCAPRSSRSCSIARRRHRSSDASTGSRAPRAVPGRLRRLLRAPRRRPTRRRCGAPTRPSSSCPASACSPTARTSRPPGSPASSTSTPST